MRAGLTSGAAIERLFIDRALRALHFHGRRAAAWDSLTRPYPAPPPGTTLFAHRPGNTGLQAAESSGAPWILADAEILTLSHPGRTSSPLEPTHTLFDDPTQALRGERLKGVEAVAWSSTITTPDLPFYHLLPRLLVIAEAAWHGEESPPWDKLAPSSNTRWHTCGAPSPTGIHSGHDEGPRTRVECAAPRPLAGQGSEQA